MNLEDRQKLVKELFQECEEVLLKKGKDYSGDKDCLSNFKRNAERLGMTKYQVWAVYANKHLDAINNGIKSNPAAPQVESEPLRLRIVDAINYLTILWALLSEQVPGGVLPVIYANKPLDTPQGINLDPGFIHVDAMGAQWKSNK